MRAPREYFRCTGCRQWAMAPRWNMHVRSCLACCGVPGRRHAIADSLRHGTYPGRQTPDPDEPTPPSDR